VALLLVVALLFTFSRGAWFGLGAATVVTSVLLRPRVLIVAALISVVAFGLANVLPRNVLTATANGGETDIVGSTFERFATIGEGNDLRVRFIDQGLEVLARDPILGVGPGQYGGAVAQTYGSSVYAELGAQAPERTVDNFWLHLLVEMGTLGTLAYIAIYFVAAWRLWVPAWRSRGLRLVFLAGALTAMGALAVDSITEMILEGNTYSMLAWLLFGATAAVYWPMRHSASPPTEEPAGQN